jgi:hypothetical protein
MKIPPDILNDILSDPFYTQCARKSDGGCSGRITFEHALLYAGRQIQEKWAIIPLCCRHHSIGEFMDTGLLDKSKNEWLAICRMTRKDEQRYPRVNWAQRRSYLCGKYGTLRLSTGRGKKALQ